MDKKRKLLGPTVLLAIFLILLIGWYFLNPLASNENVQAVFALQVPTHCIPPELAGLQDQLARLNDPDAAPALHAKIKASQDGAINCATQAAVYPTANKPATIPTMPTELPSPTPPPVQMGLQNEGLMPVPQSPFIPVFEGSYTGYNEWIGMVNGQMIRVIGGSLRDSDEAQIPLNHPEWQEHFELHAQGAVSIIINDRWIEKTQVQTSTRNGALHLINQCGNGIVLEAVDMTVFYFDLNRLMFVENSLTCPGTAQ